jgi:hypothetical protein
LLIWCAGIPVNGVAESEPPLYCLSMNSPPKKPPQIQVYRVIWTALFGSLFLYVFVNFNVMNPKTANSDPYRWFPDPNVPAELTFGIVAAVCVLVSFIVPILIARSAGPSEIPVDSDPVEFLNARLGRLFPAFIVRLALSEAVCLLGLMSSIRSHNAGVMVPFFGASVILFLRVFPIDGKKIEADLGVPSRSTY